MTRIARVGLILTAVVSGIVGLAFGPAALPAALGFGILATLIQMVAGEFLRRGADKPYGEFLKQYALGMGLRLLGVTVMAVAIVAWRDSFPPLPTAIGFLGVLVPLLFLEARLTR